MAHAVVTGSAGHLGKNLVEALLAAGWRVTGVDLREQDAAGLEAIQADVRDAERLRRAARGADVVFHMAMRPYTGVESDAELEALALDGLASAIAAVRASGVATRLVYTSSTAAVGETIDPERPRDETSWNDDPITPYTRAKVLAERTLWRAEGLDAVAVLPAMTIGPGDDRLTASNARVLEMFKRARLPLWFGGGTAVADARDVAAGHVLAASRGRAGGRYILSSENLTYRELFSRVRALRGIERAPAIRVPDAALLGAVGVVERTMRAAGKTPFVSERQMRHRLDRYAFFDARRARMELGWKPRSTDETLRDLRGFFELQGLL